MILSVKLLQRRQTKMNNREYEIIRYLINGVAATLIHYGTLTFIIKTLGFSSIGLANLIAAVVGITASFFGNRYFVFQNNNDTIPSQMLKFGSLYITIAALHGLILFFWADVMSLDYRIGFLVATTIQVLISYLGNKRWVFGT